MKIFKENWTEETMCHWKRGLWPILRSGQQPIREHHVSSSQSENTMFHSSQSENIWTSHDHSSQSKGHIKRLVYGIFFCGQSCFNLFRCDPLLIGSENCKKTKLSLVSYSIHCTRKRKYFFLPKKKNNNFGSIVSDRNKRIGRMKEI